MASTDARPIPRKNVAYRVTFPIFDADGDLVTGATGLDSEVSKDAGTFADCTSEATEIATASGMYYLDLTATEMDADTVAIIVKTSSVGAKTTPIVMYPEEAGDVRVDVVQISGDSTAADNAESFFDGTGYAGTNNVIPTVTTATNVTTVNGLAANTITAAAIATGAIDADAIADNAIDAGAIASDAITAAKIATGAITSAKFAAGAIDAAAIATDAIDNDAIAASAVTEIQSGLSTLTAAQVNAEVDTAIADVGLTTTITGRIDAAISTRATPAQVNTEVLDVLTVDTFAEPSAVPAATSTLKDKLNWLFALARNKRTTTGSLDTLRNDADNGSIATAVLSDDATTFTRAEYS